MKAPAFHYERPQSLPEVFALLAKHGDEACVLAGGQSLMPMLNMRLTSPAVLIDINTIGTLAGISVDASVLTIGAMTRHYQVAESPEIARRLPLIAEAMAHVAHAAVRNRGTFGGSLALADPAAEMPACCVALDGVMVIEGARGRRKVPAASFFTGMFATALEPDELLLAVEFPIGATGWRCGFMEFARRQGDYAILGGAAQLRLAQRRIEDVRLVLFGVGEQPYRAAAAETALLSLRPFAERLAAAKQALQAELPEFSDTQATAQMRRHLGGVLIDRMLSPFAPELD
jgi:carbon-monoxide dehydrogenase medium subunit